MKGSFSAIVSLLIIHISDAVAQQSGLTIQNTARKTSIDQPLRAIVYYKKDSSIFKPLDSTFYTWSGGRTSVQEETGVSAELYDESVQSLLGGSHYAGIRHLNTYNTDGNITETVNIEWRGGSWLTMSRLRYTYTGKLLTEMVYEVKDASGAWVPGGDKFLYKYSGGLLMEEIRQQWLAPVWINSSKTTYTYTGADLTATLLQFWNGTGWIDYSYGSSTYSGGNKMSSQGIIWNAATLSWDSTNRNFWSYTGSRLDTFSSQKWDTLSLGFENYSRYINIYSDTNLMAIISQSWISSAWQNTNGIVNNYLPSGRLNTRAHMTWNNSTNEWDSTSRAHFFYNSYDNHLETHYEQWKSTYWDTVDIITKVHFYYDDELKTSIKPSDNPFHTLSVYPNPATGADHVYVDFQIQNAEPVQITLFNTLGQTIYSGKEKGSIGDHLVEIPLQHLSSGTYFISLSGKDGNQVIKLLR